MLGSLSKGSETLNSDPSVSPSRSSPSPHLHTITWKVDIEKGYKYSGVDRTYEPIHPHIEDLHFPLSSDPETRHIAQCGAQIFAIADGHGGPGAAHYFVPRIAQGAIKILDSEPWDLSQDLDQERIASQLKQLFTSLDMEYGSNKMKQFIKWTEYMEKKKEQQENEDPNQDLQSKEVELVEKPDDDGMFLFRKKNLIRRLYHGT